MNERIRKMEDNIEENIKGIDGLDRENKRIENVFRKRIEKKVGIIAIFLWD